MAFKPFYYKVVLAVQTPNALNSTVAFNLISRSAGHTYLELYKYGEKVCSRGFRSTSTRTMLVAVSRLSFKGLIDDEKNLYRDVDLTYVINESQYNKLYKFLYRKDVPNYNVVSYNCTTFALEALEKARIEHNFKKHFWNMGALANIAGGALIVGGVTMIFAQNYGVGIAMASMGVFIASFSLSYGYYPARLAYDIHNGIH